MKKVLSIIVLLYFIINIALFSIAADYSTSARGAVVMDVNTGRVLISKSMNEKLEMASTTKIMTTLVAVENGRLKDIVKINKSACNIEGSSIYLKPGEKLALEELLYGVMLRSGNDASVAVAEYIGGSVENFVKMMNNKAKEIGAKNTHFCNPNGLPNDNHYTTAYDLALITSYALKNKKFAEIVSTKRKTISGPPDESWDRTLLNKNKMLWQFEGGNGVKTGYTKKAGRCLVSSATRNKWQLVCVVLNCGSMWEDSSRLLEYSFHNYSNIKLADSSVTYKEVCIQKGKVKTVKIKPYKDFIVPIKDDEKAHIKIKAILKTNHKAPIVKGSKAGDMKFYINDIQIGSVPLIYDENVKSNDFIYNMKEIIKNINGNIP